MNTCGKSSDVDVMAEVGMVWCMFRRQREPVNKTVDMNVELYWCR
jgi:hypothetical protein